MANVVSAARSQDLIYRVPCYHWRDPPQTGLGDSLWYVLLYIRADSPRLFH